MLALDAESDEACTAVARLALATGDTEEALVALRSMRDRAESQARVAIADRPGAPHEDDTVAGRADGAPRGAGGRPERPDRARAGRAAPRPQGDPRRRHQDARAGLRRERRRGGESAILTRLLDAPADADDAAARRGWFERLCESARDRKDVEGALATAVRAAREMPDVAPLWDRAEELAGA